MLISEEYRSLNKQLHKESQHYGTSGYLHAKQIKELCMSLGTKDVLDYGCGKSTLAKNLPFDIKEYDPCIQGKDSPPKQADIVVCTDVLEHIEPENIDSVLDDIKSLAKKAVFLTIATYPANKTLPDGRNAHLIQEMPEWWVDKLNSRFNLDDYSPEYDEGKNVTLQVVALC